MVIILRAYYELWQRFVFAVGVRSRLKHCTAQQGPTCRLYYRGGYVIPKIIPPVALLKYMQNIELI